jgi:hypothetical protein
LNPDDVNSSKGRANSSLLRSGLAFDEISQLIAGKFSNAGSSYSQYCNTPRRPTYAFSVYLLSIPPGTHRSGEIERVALGLLEPRNTRNLPSTASYELSDGMNSAAAHTVSASSYVIEMLPQHTAYFSWASALLVGDLRSTNVGRFLKLMKEVQALWSYGEAANDALEASIMKAHLGRRSRHGAASLTCAARFSVQASELLTLRGMYSFQRVQGNEKIALHSGLGDLVRRVETRVSVLRDLINIQRDEAFQSSQRLLAAVLLILAAVQAFAAWIALRNGKVIISTADYALLIFLVAAGVAALLLRR